MNCGFIITRHVNSIKTNRYWNQSIKLIRTLYPYKKIVIIDDNSKQHFVKPDYDYKNVEVIQSEFPGRGELLPYYYYLKYKWFENAIILHDSVFIHKKIDFDKIQQPVFPLWHFDYDKENIHNILRICSQLKNSHKLTNIVSNNNINILGFNSFNNFACCFGVQTYIKHSFLLLLEQKYGISNLINHVKTRTDRCSMERIMGLLFCLEHPSLLKYKSLLGNILSTGNWGYSFEDYQTAIKKRKPIKAVVKVWTGR
jgi:hypothetical protein